MIAYIFRLCGNNDPFFLHKGLNHRVRNHSNTTMSLVEQYLSTLPEHPSSLPILYMF
jgi:hypothetical protein